jgi:hypothetical protein
VLGSDDGTLRLHLQGRLEETTDVPYTRHDSHAPAV